jgi:uncharacterized integral membrane protein
MPPKLRKVVGWTLVALLALFILINFQSVEVNFLVLQVWIPKALLIFGSAALGAGAVLALRFIQEYRGGKDKAPPG